MAGRPKKNIDLQTLFTSLGVEKITSLNSKSVNEDDVLFVSVNPGVKPDLIEAFRKWHNSGAFGEGISIYFVSNDIDINMLKRSEIENK